MADDPNPNPDDKTGATPPVVDPPAPTDPPKPDDKPDDKLGEAGTKALQAERDRANAAEKAQKDFMAGLRQLLDPEGKDGKLTAEQAASKITELQSANDDTALELALYRAGSGKVNVDALLDSRAVMSKIKSDGVKPSDAAAIAKVITDAAKDPRYMIGNPGAGSGDAGAGGRTSARSVDDWIRNPDGK